MKKGNKLANCLNTNKLHEEAVICLVGEYLEELNGDWSENVFSIEQREHFDLLINLYGIPHAVELANKSDFGFVIAGELVPFSQTIAINAENYMDVFNKYAPLIEERIKTIYKEGASIEAIESLYFYVDVKKLLLEKEIVRVEINTPKSLYVEHKEFDCRKNAESWIYGQLCFKVANTDNPQVTIAKNEYIVEDLDNQTKITYTLS